MPTPHLTPEIEEALRKQRNKSTVFSVLISLLSVILLSLILAVLFRIIPSPEVETIIAYKSQQVEDLEVTEKTVKTDPRKTIKPPSSSATQSNVITSTVTTSVTIPDSNLLSTVSSSDFGSSDDFGAGSGFGDGADFGSSGSDGATLFGSTSGGGLTGYLYDLKQTRDSTPTELVDIYRAENNLIKRIGHFGEFARSEIRDKFSAKKMEKYYRGERPLSFTHLVMSTSTGAREAPEAFASPEIEPTAWVVVYEGKINPPASGSNRVRFCGVFDDFLYVYINGKMVLNGACIEQNAFGQRQHKEKPGAQLRRNFPIRIGDSVKISSSTDIRIVVSEVPGGHMGGGLFIMQDGEDYRPDGQGGKILPPFTTETLNSSDISRLSQLKSSDGKPFPVELENVPVFPVSSH